MPAPETEWTAEMVRALPDDGQRYEVLDGVLFVSPAPTWDHQRVVTALYWELDSYVRPLKLGEVLQSPADVEFSPRRSLQPDVFVIPPMPVRPKSFDDVRRLLVVAEVLSPSTARADRWDKRVIFQDERIPEYWIVDPFARVFERWTPDDERPEILAEWVRWKPSVEHAAFELDVPGFFAKALD